ncbi:hypothetical protein ACFLV6_02270 [Chloroflexota bacterium]
MSEELGKIEKPTVVEFKKGRKLYFIPLIYSSKDVPADYLEIFDKYWEQVEGHISELELKLGQISKIYHELIPSPEEDGIKVLKGLNDRSCRIVEKRVKKGCKLEVIEDAELLTEFMDWNRCLTIGLQNHKVLTKVYESYIEVNKIRNEFISTHIDETLEADEIGMLFLREEHQVKFPSGVEVFYVTPPALDELKRWLRNHEGQLSNPGDEEAGKD